MLPVYCMCVYECCMSGGMIVLLFVFIMNYNTPIYPQASIGPVRGLAAPLTPRAPSGGTSGRSCSPGLKSDPCPPMPQLTGWSVWDIAHERRTHQLCHLRGLSSPWRSPPVLRLRPQRLGHVSMADVGRGEAMLLRPASILIPHQCLCLPLHTPSSLILYICLFKLIPSPSHSHLLPTTPPKISPKNLNSYLTQHG